MLKKFIVIMEYMYVCNGAIMPFCDIILIMKVFRNVKCLEMCTTLCKVTDPNSASCGGRHAKRRRECVTAC